MNFNQISGMVFQEKLESSLKKLIPLKVFVPAERKVYENKESCSVSGTEIKRNYIDIVGRDSFQSINSKNINLKNHLPKKNKIKIEVQRKQTINIYDVMKSVETNDVIKLDEFLKTDKDFVLNVKDNFGWTPMMSACCAGAKDVVNLLLKFKPNLNVVDRTGNTCLTLAQCKGHSHIVSLLNDYLNSSPGYQIIQSNYKKKDHSTKEPDSFYCDMCNETIKKESERLHITSTVHLFNSSRKSGIPTAYGIPECNVGFQMLLKTGWDREKGLGPEGSGHKFPPKTMFKQDRAGLGAKKYATRITHDPHLAIKKYKETRRTLNRRERQYNEIKNKRKEHELRRALD